jgi:hypothetical protein
VIINCYSVQITADVDLRIYALIVYVLLNVAVCKHILCHYINLFDRLCGLLVIVSGYRSRGPGFDSLRCQIFWEVVSLERGPLSLVSAVEELLGRNSSGSCVGSREYGADHPTPSICKSPH